MSQTRRVLRDRAVVLSMTVAMLSISQETKPLAMQHSAEVLEQMNWVT